MPRKRTIRFASSSYTFVHLSKDRSDIGGRVGSEILSAAEQEFLRFGFRKASIEGIARASGHAKATVYAYFSSKELIFDAVCARSSRLLADAARIGAAKAKTPEAAAIASITGKFGAMFQVLQSSPHAEELLDASLAPDRALTRAAHDEYVAELAGLLRKVRAVKASEALELAEVINRAAVGILRAATSREECLRHLTLLLRHVLG